VFVYSLLAIKPRHSAHFVRSVEIWRLSPSLHSHAPSPFPTPATTNSAPLRKVAVGEGQIVYRLQAHICIHTSLPFPTPGMVFTSRSPPIRNMRVSSFSAHSLCAWGSGLLPYLPHHRESSHSPAQAPPQPQFFASGGICALQSLRLGAVEGCA
jgi:hypothetical protein